MVHDQSEQSDWDSAPEDNDDDDNDDDNDDDDDDDEANINQHLQAPNQSHTANQPEVYLLCPTVILPISSAQFCLTVQLFTQSEMFSSTL